MSDFAFVIAGVCALACFVVYMLVDMSIAKRDRLKKIEFDSRLTRAYDDLGLEREDSQFSKLEVEHTGFAKIEAQILRVMGIDVDKALKEARHRIIVAGFEDGNAPLHLLFGDDFIQVE